MYSSLTVLASGIGDNSSEDFLRRILLAHSPCQAVAGIRRLLSLGASRTATTGNGELTLPRSGPEKWRRRKLLVSCRNSRGPKKTCCRTCKGYQLETNSLGCNPTLRRPKKHEVIRPLSANRNTIKAIEKRGLISPWQSSRPTHHGVAFDKPRNLSSRGLVVEVETASESTQRVHSSYDCLALNGVLWN
jgi:hypothetical protein